MDGLPISAIWKISIHTPAWGATQPSHGWRKWYTYFNPHSRVGSDNINRLWWMHGSNFNPHSRVGSDILVGRDVFDKLEISIHTPAWGATCRLHLYKQRNNDFNPHSRVGSDYVFWLSGRIHRNFNPHSRVGSDALDRLERSYGKIFQSTLPRGERLQNCTKAILTKVKFYALLHTF